MFENSGKHLFLIYEEYDFDPVNLTIYSIFLKHQKVTFPF